MRAASFTPSQSFHRRRMSERFCATTGCGTKLGINSSSKCFNCREKAKRIKQEIARQKRAEEMKAAGAVLLHSCLSDGLLDPVPEKCLCRKLIPVSLAKHYIDVGRCVDLATR